VREPTDVQRVVYRNGEPWLALGPGRWTIEVRDSRFGRWRVSGTQTVPAGETAHVRYTSEGDHHLVRVRAA